MTAYETLISRRTIYAFKPDPVPDDAIRRALEAGRWAPNHKLTNPTRFVVIGPQTRAAIGRVSGGITRMKSRDVTPERVAELVAQAENKIAANPALIAVMVRRSPDDAFREREDYAAACCALHNVVLALWSEGIGAQWGTGAVIRHAETLAILGADPATEEAIGFLKIGYPQEVPAARRPDLETMVSHLP
jgi:nitroreductase